MKHNEAELFGVKNLIWNLKNCSQRWFYPIKTITISELTGISKSGEKYKEVQVKQRKLEISFWPSWNFKIIRKGTFAGF